MDFFNKLQFEMLTKENKDKLLAYIETEGLTIQHKVITPFHKSWFKGKIYFRKLPDMAKARKYLKQL